MDKEKILKLLFLICFCGIVYCQEKEVTKNAEETRKNPSHIILMPTGLIIDTYGFGVIIGVPLPVGAIFSFGDSFGWGISAGASYEGKINNYFSLVGGIKYSYYTRYSIYDNDFNINGQVRIYPQRQALTKFFISVQIDHTLTMIEYDNDMTISNIPSITPIIGYKSDKLKWKYLCNEILIGYRFKLNEYSYPNGIIRNDSILNNLLIGISYGIVIKRK
jgi:hypothetical protein